MDDITIGITGAIAANPLEFRQIEDLDAYVAVVRGFGIHPNLIIVYTYELDRGLVTLEWIGTE